ncbi:MAG: hypothetical protein CVV27_18620, partial [Candidatus Melainabacteria bacterium HGW-Melainabacteria-1]
MKQGQENGKTACHDRVQACDQGLNHSALWRWDPALPGSVQMERDQKVYSDLEPGRDPALLRFYTWSEPCLSLGRFETLAPDIEARRRKAGIAAVRRPTGGSAILHAGDLTFSLVAPSDWLPGSLLQGHQRITAALSRGLAELGIDTCSGESAPRHAYPHGDPHCFVQTSPADLRVGGHKLLGTAQVRRRKAFLLQGVIYLQANPELFANVLGADARIQDLAGLLGQPPATETVIKALTAGFSAELEICF